MSHDAASGRAACGRAARTPTSPACSSRPKPRPIRRRSSSFPASAVMPRGTRDFASPEEAEASPLAQALFDTGDVTGVFFGGDFVSVTAAPGVDWSRSSSRRSSRCCSTTSSARRRCSPAASATGISVPAEAEEDVGDDPADAEIVEQIKELIETRVRPAVANDGGDIRYRGFRDGVVYLAMQGALLGLPELDRDAQAGHRRAAQALRARSDRGPGRLMAGLSRWPTKPRSTSCSAKHAATTAGSTRDVSDAQIHAIYDLMKMGPTSANQQPARIVWCKSPEAKARLAAACGRKEPAQDRPAHRCA